MSPTGSPAGPGRRGRRAGTPDTRGRILAAARTSFSDHGYDGATVRDVARRAGVDPALVHHYFGTKQRLFLAAMDMPVDFITELPRVLAGPRAGLGERLARFVLTQWETPRMRTMIVGLMRSATTDQAAAGMLRELLTEGPILAVARAVGGPDAQLRATLAGSQLVGLAMARYIVGVEPLASAPVERLARTLGPTLERYLVGDLEAPVDRSPDAPDPGAPRPSRSGRRAGRLGGPPPGSLG